MAVVFTLFLNLAQTKLLFSLAALGEIKMCKCAFKHGSWDEIRNISIQRHAKKLQVGLGIGCSVLQVCDVNCVDEMTINTTDVVWRSSILTLNNR